MLSELSQPIIFAHRGASAHAPENTIPAFELALAVGADAIEVDAKLTVDGQIVGFHDATVDRTTEGTGRLSQKTLAELRLLDAGSFFSEKFCGTRIPTLNEIFEAVGKKIFINIELTNYATPYDALVEKVSALVKKHALEKSVMFSSFLPSNLKQAEFFLPENPRGLLALHGWKGAWARSFGFSFGEYAALHPYLTDVDPQQISRVHQLKHRIHVWTVNKPEDISRFHSWGVDGIFTDDPKLALQLIGSKS